jgi:hypothetical protein
MEEISGWGEKTVTSSVNMWSKVERLEGEGGVATSDYKFYTELEFLNNLWGARNRVSYRPPGYIGWRNSFLGSINV